MNHLFSRIALTFTLSLSIPSAAKAVLITTGGITGTGAEAMSQVNYDGLSSQSALQNENNRTLTKSSTSVLLTSIVLGNGITLDNFDAGGVQAVNLNLGSNVSRFSVLDNNTEIQATDEAAYISALSDSFSNRNILNYSNKDSGASNTGSHDFDIIFQYGISANDYMVIGERDGNSAFQLNALDSNGNVISGSQDITFDGSSYSWNTGYASEAFHSGQPIWLSVIGSSLFDVGTDTIFGIRVTNPGGADVKILAASDDSIVDNNPINPNFVSPIPESSSYALLFGLVTLGLTATRRRRG